MTKHTEMVERVARVMAGEVAEYTAIPFDSMAKDTQLLYLDIAEHAIKAMREPTPRMALMGSKRYHFQKPNLNRIGTEVYQAMIDAALNGDGE